VVDLPTRHAGATVAERPPSCPFRGRSTNVDGSAGQTRGRSTNVDGTTGQARADRPTSLHAGQTQPRGQPEDPHWETGENHARKSL